MRLMKKLVCVAMLLCAMQPVTAGTVTLGFEAEVASVVPIGEGLDLPFDVEVGDIIMASFAASPETGSLRIQTDEFFLEKTDYSVVVENDAPDWIPLMGRIADPENTPVVDRGPGGVSDVFRVGCAETEDIALCEGTPLMGDQAILWIASVSLIGDSALISSENETLNLSTLNAFSFREMSLTFFDPSTGNAVKVGAFVGDVRVVPEPASTQLITALLPMLILCTSLHACPWRPHFRHKNATGE